MLLHSHTERRLSVTIWWATERRECWTKYHRFWSDQHSNPMTPLEMTMGTVKQAINFPPYVFLLLPFYNLQLFLYSSLSCTTASRRGNGSYLCWKMQRYNTEEDNAIQTTLVQDSYSSYFLPSLSEAATTSKLSCAPDRVPISVWCSEFFLLPFETLAVIWSVLK